MEGTDGHMGSKQRRERERQALRQAILDAAREIAASEGWQAVTIRKVAEAIDYTPPIIYEYFDSKNDLLLALLIEGFQQLTQSLQQAQTGDASPQELLLQVALAYWRFAFMAPELYQVMHGLGGVPFGTAETPQDAHNAFAALRSAVCRVLDAQGVQLPDVDGEVDLFWSTLHGLITLTMAGRMKGGVPRAFSLVERAVHNLLRAWTGEVQGMPQPPYA